MKMLEDVKRVLGIDGDRRCVTRVESARDEQERLQTRLSEIQARLELLRIRAEQPALRQGYRPHDKGAGT